MTLNSMPGPWQQRLADLLAGRHTATGDELDAGAQLVVAEPDGTEIARAALARHHRLANGDPPVLWIRPITGRGEIPGSGDPVFDLSLARRRGLALRSANVEESGEISLELTGGQSARIQRAAGAELDDLAAWDEFTLTRLSPAQEATLEALDTDS